MSLGPAKAACGLALLVHLVPLILTRNREFYIFPRVKVIQLCTDNTFRHPNHGSLTLYVQEAMWTELLPQILDSARIPIPWMSRRFQILLGRCACSLRTHLILDLILFVSMLHVQIREYLQHPVQVLSVH
jgi:hypothetical protein